MPNRHLSRHARDRYALDSLRFPDLASARKIAAQMNVPAGDLYALGLIDEALRILLTRHAPPAQMTSAASFLDLRLGAAPVRDTQVRFVSAFPTPTVYRGEISAQEFLNREEGEEAKLNEKEEKPSRLAPALTPSPSPDYGRGELLDESSPTPKG